MSRNTTVVICSIALLGALVLLWLQSRPAGVKVSRAEVVNVQASVGLALAEETIKAIQDHGSIVIVTADPPERLHVQSNSQWHAFESELQKHGAIHITAIEGVKFELESGQLFCPPAAFEELWERHATADALIFLIDLPEWAAVAGAMAPSGKPKIIAVDNVGALTKVHYGGYFTSGILAALIGKAGRPVQNGQPKTSREWFEKYYQVYTPQNIDSLPDAGERKY